MGVARDLLVVPSERQNLRTCQRQQHREPASNMAAMGTQSILEVIQSIFVDKKGDWSVDPGSVLQLLGESPGLVDFLLELLVQDPIQEQPSTAAQLSTPTSSTCSGSVISLEAQSLDNEDSAWSTLETESSYEDECIASTSPPLIGRYKQDASKIESGQAIEFLELARSRLSHGDYASLLEVFCSLHKVEEVTEKMEMEIWALISLDSELTLSFQKLFPSLA